MCRLQCRLDAGFATFLQVFGELDDEDGIFHGQANDGDDADFQVHVILEEFSALSKHQIVIPVAAKDATRNTKDAKRHNKNYRKRDGPAFVQRCETEENGEQAEAEDVHLLVARALFFQC